MSPIEIPSFATESEEAQWWFDNQERLDDEFLQAVEEGRLGRGTVIRLSGLGEDSIYLDPAELDLLRLQAQKRGLKYQTYLKMLLHEALTREAEATKA